MPKPSGGGKGGGRRARQAPEGRDKPEGRRAVWHVGGDALTGDDAKNLMGLEVEGLDTKEEFGEEYLLKARVGDARRKVRATKNAKNRAFTVSLALERKQDILMRRWRINGEGVIIGDGGNVISGQHRLVGLWLACLEWEESFRWKELWEEAPVLETLVVYGISETEDVLRTIDNVRPRTFADTLFSSGGFRGMGTKARAAACRYADHAVRLLWHRTGEMTSAFSPARTNSEAGEFLARHPRLADCVKHVFEEDRSSKGGIHRYLPLGYAAGMLYLMGSCSSDYDDYATTEPERDEQHLDWGYWDRACEFWSQLSKATGPLSAVRDAFSSLYNPKTGEGKPSVTVRLALVSLAWNVFRGGHTPDKDDLDLEGYFGEDKDERKVLVDTPHVGGIDLGDPDQDEKAREAAEAPPAPAAGANGGPGVGAAPGKGWDLDTLAERARAANEAGGARPGGKTPRGRR